MMDTIFFVLYICTPGRRINDESTRIQCLLTNEAANPLHNILHHPADSQFAGGCYAVSIDFHTGKPETFTYRDSKGIIFRIR